MGRDRMRQTLETLRAEEVEGVLTFIKLNERARHIDADEAAEWRRRILARQRFLGLKEQSGPAN